MESDVNAVELLDSTVIVEEFKVETVDEVEKNMEPQMRIASVSSLAIPSADIMPSTEIKTEPIFIAKEDRGESSKQSPHSSQSPKDTSQSSRMLKFSCQICERVFHKVTDLVQHVRFCKGPNVEVVEVKTEEVEDMEMSSEAELIMEEDPPSPPSVSRLQAKEYQCPICYKNFQSNWHLQDHIVIHSAPTLHCKKCNNTYRKKKTLKRHYEMCIQMDGIPEFPCKVCGNRYYDVRVAHRHEKFCANYDDQTTVPSKMSSGSFSKSPNEGKELFSCKVCDKKFQHERNLKEHMLVHRQSQPGFSCRLCGNTYWNEDDLEEHEKDCKIQEGTPNFFCIICGNRFHTENALLRHYDTCKKEVSAELDSEPEEVVTSGQPKSVYTCEICGEIFRRNHSLQSHRKDCVGSVLCSNCGKSIHEDYFKKHEELCLSGATNDDDPDVEEASNPSQLSDGISENGSSVHTEEKIEYVCKICHKKVKDKWGLKAHMIVHTDERPYACDHCGNKYKWKGDMVKHNDKCKTMTTLPSFICVKCGNKFHERNMLQKHYIHCSRRHVVKTSYEYDGAYTPNSSTVKTETANDCDDDDAGDEKSLVINYKCRICSKTIKYKKNIKGHMLLHGLDRPYRCNTCGNRYKRSDTRNAHAKKCWKMPTPPKYTCVVCANRFHTEKVLKKHMNSCGVPSTEAGLFLNSRYHDKERGIHKCLICHRVMHKNSLTKHMLIHSNVKSFECGKCGNTYKRKDALEFHTNLCKKIATPPKFVCGTCGNKYHSEKALSTHSGSCGSGCATSSEIRSGKKEEGHKCPICPRVFRFKRNMREHVPTHNANRPYKCEKCGNKYKRRDTLSSHIKVCLKKRTQPKFSCRICGNKFHLEKVYTRHLNSCKLDAERNGTIISDVSDDEVQNIITCPICFKIITHKKSLALHMRIHSSVKPFKCAKCGNAYRRKDALEFHVKLCSQMKGDPTFDCKICGNKYHSERTLNTHMGSCSLNVRDSDVTSKLATTYKCHICSTVFNYRKELEEHVTIHETDRPFKCNKCGNQYKRMDTLNSHEKTCHNITGDPKYACKTCGNKFYREKYLKGHIQKCELENLGVKADVHKCPVCFKVVKYKSDLSRHMLSHSSTRPFKCDKCGNNYKRQESLDHHVKVCTEMKGQPQFTCNVCGNKFYWERVLKGHVHKCKVNASLTADIQSVSSESQSFKEEPPWEDVNIEEVFNEVKDEEMPQDTRTEAISNDATEDGISNDAYNEEFSLDIKEEELSHDEDEEISVDEKGEEIRKCPICSIKFESREELEEHAAIHETDRPFKCNKCGNKYKRKDTLYRHELTCLKMTTEPKYPCTVCGNRFYWQRNLTKHTYKCKLEDLNKTGSWLIPGLEDDKKLNLKCPICPLKAKYKSELRRHMLTHSSTKLHKCIKCGNKYKWKDVQRRHMKMCLKMKTEPKYSCTMCGNKFYELKIWKRHLYICKMESSGVRPPQTVTPHKKDIIHKCSVCSMVFSENWILQRHMRMHSSVKPFECTKCGNKYRRNDSLILHSQTCLETKTDPQYVCQGCGNKYHTKIALSTHSSFCSAPKSGDFDAANEMGDAEPHKCHICHKILTYRSELERHMLTHSSLKSFKCIKCGNKYKRKNALHRHVKMCLEMKGQPTYVCQTCGNKFHWEKALQKHMHKCKSDPSEEVAVQSTPAVNDDHVVEVHKCSICFRRFKDKFILRRHMLVHSSRRPFECSNCGNKFRRNDSLINHEQTCHEMKTAPKFVCEHCGNKYHSKIALNTHVSSCDLRYPNINVVKVEPQDEKEPQFFKCPICPKTVNYRSVLDRHMLTHSSIKTFECAKCGNKYKRKETLYHHVKMCIKIKGNPQFGCKFCGNRFHVNSVLKKHIHKCEMEHLITPKLAISEPDGGTALLKERLQAHRCPICAKLVKDKFILRRHMLIHSSDKPFECSTCGNKYRRSDALSHHMQTCSGMMTKPEYSCEGCGNRYHSKIALNTHVTFCDKCSTRTMRDTINSDEDERPPEVHKCPICPKTVNYKSELHRHMLSHSSVKAFKCAKCGNRYKRKESLYRHVKVCLKMKNLPKFNCTVCGNKFYDAKVFKGHRNICKLHMDVPSAANESVVSTPPLLVDDSTTEVSEYGVSQNSVVNYKCNICSKIIKYKRNVAEHMISHTGPRLSCSKCGNTYQHERAYTEHTKMCITMEGTPKFLCSTCGNKFYKVASLRSHRASCKDEGASEDLVKENDLEFANEAGVYKCSTCFTVFKKQRYLKQHMSVHKSDRPFVCTKCGNKYKRQSGLSHHQELCKRMTSEPKFICDNCGNKYHKSVTLEMHVGFCRYTTNKNAHVGVPPSSELEVSRLLDIINVNVAAVQTGQLPLADSSTTAPIHQCHLCLKIFKERRYLRRHMTYHKDQYTSYKCKKCGNEYKRKDTYTSHVSLCAKMDGEPKHSCQLCGNKFYEEMNLRGHMRKCASQQEELANYSTESETEITPGHSRDVAYQDTSKTSTQVSKNDNKPTYACIICGRRFNMKLTLEKHKFVCMYAKRMAVAKQMAQNTADGNLSSEEEKPTHLVGTIGEDNGNSLLPIKQETLIHDELEIEEHKPQFLMDFENDISGNIVTTVKQEPEETYSGTKDIYTITELPPLAPISQNYNNFQQLPQYSTNKMLTTSHSTPIATTPGQPQYYLKVGSVNNMVTVNISTSPKPSEKEQQASASPIPSTSYQASSDEMDMVIDEDNDPIISSTPLQTEYRALNRPAPASTVTFEEAQRHEVLDVIELDDDDDEPSNVQTQQPTTEWYQSTMGQTKFLRGESSSGQATFIPTKEIPTFACKGCNKKYTREHDLRRHKNFCLGGNNVQYQCITCKMKFPSMLHYRRHQPTCKKVTVGATSAAKQGASSSTFTQVIELPGMYRCHICMKDFRQKNLLDHHIKLVHIMSDRSHVCKKCGNKYRWKNTLISHEKVCHPAGGMPEFKCKTCGNRFYSVHNFRGHEDVCKRVNTRCQDGKPAMEIINSPDTDVFQCMICFKIFKLRISYLNHMHSHNNENKVYKCDLCENTFKVEKNYNEHYKLCKAKVPCGSCGTRFSLQFDLMEHMKVCGKSQLPVVVEDSEPAQTDGDAPPTEHYQIVEIMYMNKDGKPDESFELVMEDAP